jgi:hypothetical protein
MYWFETIKHVVRLLHCIGIGKLSRKFISRKSKYHTLHKRTRKKPTFVKKKKKK